MKKRDGRSISRETLEYLRKQSIKLWKKEKSINDISDFCGVHFTVVYKWIRMYKNKGLDGLNRKKAPGAEPKLSNSDIKKLLELIKKPATDYDFENPLWNCKKIRQLIVERLNKKIDFSNVWRLLVKIGLSPQKPEKEALERNKRKVKRWIRETWPEILKQRRKWQAIIYFLDESGVSLIPVIGTTWAPKGKTPIVKVTGKRGNVLVTSVISQSGKLLFRIEKDTINAGGHIAFIKQVQNNHPNRKIIIIEDNARPHIADFVKRYVESQKNKLKIYYLPAYSPDLNPAEEIWRYLKHEKLKAHQAKSLDEFEKLVHNKMISIRQKKGIVNSFFYGCPLF